MTEIIRNLKAINFALNNLEVKGRSNLDILLGAMQSLDRDIAELEKIQDDMTKPVNIKVTEEEPK